jgi:hypothetical protein
MMSTIGTYHLPFPEIEEKDHLLARISALRRPRTSELPLAWRVIVRARHQQYRQGTEKKAIDGNAHAQSDLLAV